MVPECLLEQYGAPEAEAQQGEVLVGCSTGGAAGLSRSIDRLDFRRITTGNGLEVGHNIRFFIIVSSRRRDTFPEAECYLELFAGARNQYSESGVRPWDMLNLSEIVQWADQ